MAAFERDFGHELAAYLSHAPQGQEWLRMPSRVHITSLDVLLHADFDQLAGDVEASLRRSQTVAV